MSVPAKAAGSAVALLAAVFLLVLAGPAGKAQAPLAPQEAEAHGLALVLRDAEVTTPMRGDVQALGGSLLIDAAVEGDVIAIGSQLRFGPNARVSGNLVALGGSVESFDRSRVAGDTWVPGSLGTIFGATGSGDALTSMMNEPFSLAAAAIKLALTLGWILIAILVVLVAGREVRSTSFELRESLFHSFLLGLVAFTSFVLTALVFGYLIPYGVGVVLLAILGAVAVVAKVYGMIAVFHAVGAILAGPRTHSEAGVRWLRGDLALTVVGAVTLGALRLVPLVGNVVWIAATIAGIGVALATCLGRREPWFLAARSVNDVS
jgi:hypothetical protein